MHDIRIAIVGGGIARLTLLQALLQYSHLDANLYDAGSAVAGEGGANVGLNINASMALEKISPQLRSALDLAGAVPGVTQLRVGKGMRFGHSLSTGLRQPTNVELGLPSLQNY